MHTSRHVLRAIVLAVVNFLIGGQVLAQELSIPLVTTPPALADFVSMTPADDVRARYGYVSGFTQRAPQDGAPSSQRTDVYLGYDSQQLLRHIRRVRRRPRKRARQSRPAGEHRERRPRRLAHRHLRRSTHGVWLPLEPARRAVGRPLVRGDARRLRLLVRGGLVHGRAAHAGRLRRPHDDSVSHDAVSRDRRAALARAVRTAHSALERGELLARVLAEHGRQTESGGRA